jgi:hypothetical protein
MLERLDNVAGTDAAGADLDGSDISVSDSFDFLEIRVPDGTGFVFCMADVVTEAGAFSTYCAYS